MYTKVDFKQMISDVLKQGYCVKTISKAAYNAYLSHLEVEAGLDEIMLEIVTMDEGPEFEMSEDEFLRFISEI